MKKRAWIAGALSALLGVSIGCGGGGGGGPGGKVDPVAWDYPETKMVVSAIYLPLSSQEAKDYAFDLDHDGDVDNQLGNILAALKSAMGETNPQSAVEDAMNKGSIIVLFSIFAETMLDSKSANLWAFLGQSVTIDPPTGPAAGDTFTVDTVKGPVDAYFGGKIKGGGGVFGGDEAQLRLDLPLTEGSALQLSLQAVNMDFDISSGCAPGGCEFTNGRLGGAVTESDLNTKVLPEVTKLLQDQLVGNCTDTSGSCVCTSGSGAETIQSMFDTNLDCEVTLDEVQNNSIIKAFLKGDVTLKDGSKALSMAIGFDAIDAKFDHAATPQ